MIKKHPLQEYAVKSGKTIKEIAAEAGCSRMTLYRLMNGSQNATIDLLERVSNATGNQVHPVDFMGNRGR